MISVGLPVFNGEKYVSDAIRSVLSQTYKNFELIISDDASTDTTRDICLKFAKKDSRIKVFQQQKNIGFLKNFNFVLKKAKYEYFVWIGQDDYWDKTFLEKLFNLIAKDEENVLSMCNTINVAVEKNKSSIFQIEKYPFQDFTNNETRFESLLKFIKSGNLTYYYGLHKTFNLRKIGGYQKSSRPFFKSSDYMTIFKVLVKGKMVFTNEYLFFKRDTGHYFRRYEDLKRLQIDKKYLRKSFRYLFFPVYFFYDLVNSVKCLTLSDFTFLEKSVLTFFAIIFFIRRYFTYLFTIFYAFILLAKSLFLKIFFVYDKKQF